MRLIRPAALLPLLPLFLACGGAAPGTRWSGSIDTLASGMVQVTNPAEGVWDSASAWHVVEELRIGRVDGDGPDLLGQVVAVEVDAQDRLWVLEGQSEEIRVFDRTGRHVRTIGRKGKGPGEFASPLGLTWAPDGTLWVPDPQNNRISVIDTAGAFVTSHRMLGGFTVLPWPGGFDAQGSFYNYVPDRSSRGFSLKMVRYDTALTALDTLTPPKWQGPRESFELTSADGRSHMMTDVPFTPSLQWRLTTAGEFWFVLTGPYELYRMNRAGDTVRKVTKAFTQVAVTGEDMDSALAGLAWFTKQGGKVDRSRIPSTKPAVASMFVSDEGDLWVEPTTADAADRRRLYDVFDPDGRYLGRVRLPFKLGWSIPIIRGDLMIAVTQDELEVPFVVRAKIRKPTEQT